MADITNKNELKRRIELFLDELDAYPQTLAGEGSPIDLAVKRTESYSRTRKIGYISTPLLSCTSHIKEYYEKGDQRKFYVPCPFCHEKQELIFYSHDGGLYGDNKAVIDEDKNYKNNDIKVKRKPYGLIFNSEECKNGKISSTSLENDFLSF